MSIAVVAAIFAGVLPRIADYSEAWRLVEGLTATERAGVAALAVVNLLSYAPLWVAAMPGLTLPRAVMADQASTAIANTVPAGFAFGVGVNAAMYHSIGFTPAAIARAVAITGVWNNLVKLGLPAVALIGIALVGDVDRGLGTAALLGGAVLVSGFAALVSMLTHAAAAATLAAAAERLASRAARLCRRPPPSGWVAGTDRFRTEALDLIRQRWLGLSLAAVGSHGALFVLLLVCLHAVAGKNGGDVPWLVVLAVFSITRLVTIVPLTPGTLGVAELSYVAGLTAVGVTPAAAAGTVLLFRFLTWFLPIPIGLLCWLWWRRGAGHMSGAVSLPARP